MLYCTHGGVFRTTWKPLPVSHIFTVMSWIVAQPSLCVCVCVFYNWLCLVHNPANNASPFCSSLRYGKIVSTKAILDKATNKCKGVWCCLFSALPFSFLSLFHTHKIVFHISRLLHYYFPQISPEIVNFYCVNSSGHLSFACVSVLYMVPGKKWLFLFLLSNVASLGPVPVNCPPD